MSLSKMLSLEGRVGLVTGGTRGIGAQMAIALAEAGADIILVQVQETQCDTCTRIVMLMMTTVRYIKSREIPKA